MKNINNFQLGAPKTREQIKLQNSHNVQFLYSEDGTEWYACQQEFAQDTIKFAYDEKGVIRSIANNKDVSTLWPVGLSVAEVADTTANRRADAMGGWVFDGENIVKRVYTEEELKARAETEKAKRLAFVNKKTQAWQAQLMLGMIDEEDKLSLIAWMKYVKQVQAIDISAGSDIVWPEQPD